MLAFGNGAPDVFSALSASKDATSTSEGSGEGFYLAAAGSLGSGFFVSTIVASAIILLGAAAPTDQTPSLVLGSQNHRQTHRVQINPHSFIRDLLFYLVTALILCYAIFIRERFDMVMSIAFLLVYTM